MPRILICYLVQNSGHHSAARAIEAALHRVNPGVETLCVDLLAYTHPYWAAIIQKTYMGTIRRTPDVWEALYDNPVLDLLTRKIRKLIQRGRSKPLLSLMDDFRPDAAVCTQAHPFAVLSAYITHQRSTMPLWGVVTDYIPHRFWKVDGPGSYVVPIESARDRLVWRGVDPRRIRVLGIPVNPDLVAGPGMTDLENGQRRVLVMGGSRGLSVKYRTVRNLDRCPEPFIIDVITGSNRKLRKQLVLNRRKFNHPIKIRGYVRNAPALMRRASLLISKPGGLTSAEAMVVGVPMLLVRPLPGQERGNADALVRHGSAVHLPHDRHVASVATTLLSKPELLAMMRERALAMGRPDAALQIARDLLADVGSRVGASNPISGPS